MEWIIGFLIMAVHAAMIIFEPILFAIRLSKMFVPDSEDCKNCTESVNPFAD